MHGLLLLHCVCCRKKYNRPIKPTLRFAILKIHPYRNVYPILAATMRRPSRKRIMDTSYYCLTCLLVQIITVLTAAIVTVTAADPPPYANVTLTSREGDLSVMVFLPVGVKTNENPYYMSTRFEHGSMIGSIKRTSIDPRTKRKRQHTLFGTSLWRNNDFPPYNNHHDPGNPESGVGLASEFGVGDDGAFCFYRCGWYGVNDVTNGLLGYRDAKDGEPFLKIGVGKLVKGTCPACDSTNDYKFNSPYRYAEAPRWYLIELQPDSIVLEHDAHLTQTVASQNNNILNNINININQNKVVYYGYRLRKDITVHQNYILVTTTLTNLGKDAFTTAWYSHNFFTCDAHIVSKDYSVTLDMDGVHPGKKYEEPGLMAQWATPLANYADVSGTYRNITVDVKKNIDDNTKIKAEFVKDVNSKGTFTIRACGTSIHQDIPELQKETNPPDQQQYSEDGVSMYAYNLYIEKGTFSPEPQILIHLESRQSKSWTQRIVIGDAVDGKEAKASFTAPTKSSDLLRSISPNMDLDSTFQLVPEIIIISLLASLTALLVQIFRYRHRYSRRYQYTKIPENEEQIQRPRNCNDCKKSIDVENC